MMPLYPKSLNEDWYPMLLPRPESSPGQKNTPEYELGLLQSAQTLERKPPTYGSMLEEGQGDERDEIPDSGRLNASSNPALLPTLQAGSCRDNYEKTSVFVNRAPTIPIEALLSFLRNGTWSIPVSSFWEHPHPIPVPLDVRVYNSSERPRVIIMRFASQHHAWKVAESLGKVVFMEEHLEARISDLHFTYFGTLSWDSED